MSDIHISVRTLVEYVYSSGSIDARFRPQSTLVDGTRAHQKIQKTYKDGDQKEVYLSVEIPFEGMNFVIDGRCDGLLFQDEAVTIDEIKSFSHGLEQLEGEGYPVHWAQAKVYAFIYAREHQLEDIFVQLTYVNTESDEKKYYKKKFTFTELEGFIYDVIKNYAPYARLQLEHLSNRNTTAKELAFPFPAYRNGQRQLAGAVYKTITERKNLFAKAPTGIGKTISTLFPSIKAMGEGHISRVFYLTAKTITRTTAEEAFGMMRSCGLSLKSLTITAKDKVCFKEETKCQKEYCEFANGYYDRINPAVLDILSNEQGLTRQVIEEYALKHKVCPFEFSIDLAYAVDAVICDYNYIFDPQVSLKRLLEEQKKSTVLLVDEAHNMVDRGREMFSASINKDAFLQLKREFKGINKPVCDAAGKVNSWFISLKKEQANKNEFVIEELDESLVDSLRQFIETAEPLLKSGTHPSLLDSYFTVQSFLKVAELLDDHFVIYGEKNRNDLFLKLFCIDPSELLKQTGKSFRSKVFFSATLSPMTYYRDIVGGNEDDYSIMIPSPFSKDQTNVYLKPLSTRYRDRENTKGEIVSALHSLIKNKPGNWLIFFPSYQYLLSVYEQFKEEDPESNTILQSTGMTEDDREAFLREFQHDATETLIGFAVLGGIFSEGIDLKGDRLNGVAVVGVGLPQLCFERDLIKNHFTKNGKNGYNYAYVYPGMNKVLQAGGRLIRSEKDHGTIVLIDDRFLKQPYHSLLPEEWSNYTII
jgi:DNA excision repair protein ERCC-2